MILFLIFAAKTFTGTAMQWSQGLCRSGLYYEGFVAQDQLDTLFELTRGQQGRHMEQGQALASFPGPARLSLAVVSCPDPPRKAERGSGVLNYFSCHMGRGRMA